MMQSVCELLVRSPPLDQTIQQPLPSLETALALLCIGIRGHFVRLMQEKGWMTERFFLLEDRQTKKTNPIE